MSVGECLEISEIRCGATIAAFVELYAFLDLLTHAFLWLALRRVEGVVATESAASGADGAVTIGTAETRVDADFLYTGAELALDV